MNVLPYFEAYKLAHEVACFVEFERDQGAFDVCEFRLGCAVIPGMKWGVGENLRGACWIASYIVARVLQVRGYRAGVVYDEWNRHAYVLTECGKCIDVTIMQFDDLKEPHVGWIDWNHERGPNGWLLRALMHKEGTIQFPSWPGYHRDAIERILRRLGVEGVEDG